MKEIEKFVKIAEIVSRKNGRSWLQSNGKELKVAYNESEMEFNKNHGFWNASIFENGHRVEA